MIHEGGSGAWDDTPVGGGAGSRVNGRALLRAGRWEGGTEWAPIEGFGSHASSSPRRPSDGAWSPPPPRKTQPNKPRQAYLKKAKKPPAPPQPPRLVSSPAGLPTSLLTGREGAWQSEQSKARADGEAQPGGPDAESPGSHSRRGLVCAPYPSSRL